MSASDSEKAVLLDVQDGTATITLNRPEVRNALIPEIQTGIRNALNEIDDREDVRCVVLTGNGNAFCAGGDVSGMDEDDDSTAAESAEGIVGSVNQLITRVARLPLPTVAKIDGPAFGAGAALSLACDMRVASETAQISFGFRQVGLTVDSGISYFLPRLVGQGTAKDLVLTGRLVDAEEAAELGLFERVYDAETFDTTVDEFVSQFSDGPTVALRTSKRLLDLGTERSLEDALQAEATAQATVLDTRDHAEGVDAFFEDRPPEFKGE